MESLTHPGPGAESGGVLSRVEQGRQVAVVLEKVSPLPSEAWGSGVSPALGRPERRHHLRHGTGGGAGVNPGLVQRRSAFWKRAEGDRVLRPGLGAAPAGVWSLEGCSVTLLLMRWWRVPALLSLFEREVVPVWDRRWARPGEHWLVRALTGIA